MRNKKLAAWLLIGVATTACLSTGALAATEKEQQLEARERAIRSLQGELQTTKDGQRL